jgi:hypothetical protein
MMTASRYHLGCGTSIQMNNIQWSTNRRLVLIGILALVIGVALYVFDRPSAQTYFVPNALSLFKGAPSVFGKVGYHLPTFLHAFAFCLITSGVMGYGPRGTAVVCLLWLLVDGAFEIGQRPDIANEIVPHIPDWFKHVPILENTADYFIYGRFDPMDLAAILLGAIVAYVLTLVLHTKN